MIEPRSEQNTILAMGKIVNLDFHILISTQHNIQFKLIILSHFFFIKSLSLIPMISIQFLAIISITQSNLEFDETKF